MKIHDSLIRALTKNLLDLLVRRDTILLFHELIELLSQELVKDLYGFCWHLHILRVDLELLWFDHLEGFLKMVFHKFYNLRADSFV